MSTYVYVAWFRDNKFPADHQDYEWPGVWIVEAESTADAQRLGDRYASHYADELGEQFLRSRVDEPTDYPPDTGPWEPLPSL
jgi:hypothetical protein